MHCHIVVLPADSPHPVDTWYGETRAYEGSDLEEFLHRIAVERVRQESQSPQGLWRIFVCPYGNSLLNPDPASLREILARLHVVGWGARVYVGISNSLSDTVLTARPAAMKALLKAAIKERSRDLFSVSLKGVESPDPMDLHELARAVESEGGQECGLDFPAGRQFLLDSLRQHQVSWACLLADEIGLARQLLAGWRPRSTAPAERQRLVIVPPSHGNVEFHSLEQARFIRKALERFPNRPHIVATLGLSPPTKSLEELCRGEGLFGPFRFRHELELWYFLQRLTRRGNGYGMPSSVQELLHLVRPTARGHFATSSLGLPAVLMTSSFSPREEVHCLEASQDVAEILSVLPAEIDVHIEPAVTLESLRRLLAGAGRSPKFHAWFHLGHGTGRHGLADAEGAQQPVERWLDCFQDCALPLELAAFLTCDSHEAARAFAEAGVGITVGYRGQVDTSTARRVAIAIARQMAVHGFRRRALLRGFEAGARHFLAAGQDGVEPVAYASVRA